MTTTDLAHKLTVVGAELANLGDLPEIRSVLFMTGDTVLIPKDGYRPWEQVRAVIGWAEHFSVDLEIGLDACSTGRIHASFMLGGVVVAVEAGSIGSSRAYELGRVLQRPLDPMESLTVTAARLRAALDELAPVTTS